MIKMTMKIKMRKKKQKFLKKELICGPNELNCWADATFKGKILLFENRIDKR